MRGGVEVEVLLGFFWLGPLDERKAVLFIREHRRGAGVQLTRPSGLLLTSVSQGSIR